MMFLGASAFAQTGNRIAVDAKNKTKPAAAVEDDGWKKGGEGMINLSATQFGNWAAGGANSASLIGNLNLFADRTYSSGWLWENDLRLVYGFASVGWLKFNEINNLFLKADDIIDFDSKMGRKINDKLYWSNLLTFDTQFSKGFTLAGAPTYLVTAATDGTYNANDTITNAVVTTIVDTLGTSGFLSPAYITFGTGLDYKPSENLSVYFSPITFRGLIVNDQFIADKGIHGNKPGQRFKPELGANFIADYKRNITETISYASHLELYSNFLKNKFEKVQPQLLDVRWVNSVGVKLTKYISARAEHTLIYDGEVDLHPENNIDGTLDVSPEGNAEWQSKLFVGIGFSYKF